MSKHSQSPWSCAHNSYGRSDAEFLVFDGDGNFLSHDDEVNEKNAILISAAPDMLFALEIAQEFLTDRAKEIVQEAIAKAKGE